MFGKNKKSVTIGCICCTLRDAFMEQIEQIASEKKTDRILVEASGISDPSAIAAAFIEYQKMETFDKAYLDSVVCVVDVDRIYSEFLDELKEKDDMETDQDPDIINLIMDQIEFCNTILLNKCDLLPASAVEEVRKTIRTLQKDADIIECIQGKVNPDRIFRNRKFDYEKVMHSARRNASVTVVSNWLAAFDEEERKRQTKDYPEVMEDWDDNYGDRLNQIVFIGKNINREKIEKRLCECICKGEKGEMF